LPLIEQMTREAGQSARTFKSGIIWSVADSDGPMIAEAREPLAWEEIDRERDMLRLEEWQTKELASDIQKARRDLREAFWRAHRYLMLLDKEGGLKEVDLGLVHSSAADTMVNFILNCLTSDGDITDSVGP